MSGFYKNADVEAAEEAAFQRGKRRGYTDGYFAAEVAARPVLQDALDMLRTERYGNTDPDKRERCIERIERFIKGAPGVALGAPTDWTDDATCLSALADRLEEESAAESDRGNDSAACAWTCRAYEVRQIVSRMVRAHGVSRPATHTFPPAQGGLTK